MEKKGTIISLIFVAVIVLSAALFIIFSGITANEYNYVQLEVNPRVEFICDKNFKVISFRPLNDDAKVVLAGVEYKGMDIEDASADFMDVCARTGFIDVNGNDNAVNITVVDGITQALDVHVVQSINEYLQKNEILCAVTENYEDRSMNDAKKEYGICCSNKYKLISTLIEYDSNLTIQDLKKLSEVELIDMITNIHTTESFTPSEDDIELKTKMIDFNRVKYNTHKSAITDATQREFAEIFNDFRNLSSENYRQNYTKQYIQWQNNRVS